MVCGRYARLPPTVTEPADGRSRPASRRSRVDFPAPLEPMRPVRPRPKLRDSPSKSGVPSGHSKRRAEQAREMGDAVWVLMVVLAIAGAVVRAA
jgi:hypothetical protein